MLPQTDISTNKIRTLLEIPSKTYKLNLNMGKFISLTDNSLLPTFEIVDGDLIVTYNNDDPTFNIENNDLIITSFTDDIYNYQLINNNMYYLDNFYSDRIIGYVDNLEAVKQSVYHILMTERYQYMIYGNNYGVELDQYKNKSFDYLRTTIENTLREALTYDLRIKDIHIDDIRQDKDSAFVQFTVYSIYGNLKMEVNVVV